MSSIVKQSAYLWTGSLLVATASALLGYLLLSLIWMVLGKAIKGRRSERA